MAMTTTTTTTTLNPPEIMKTLIPHQTPRPHSPTPILPNPKPNPKGKNQNHHQESSSPPARILLNEVHDPSTLLTPLLTLLVIQRRRIARAQLAAAVPRAVGLSLRILRVRHRRRGHLVEVALRGRRGGGDGRAVGRLWRGRVGCGLPVKRKMLAC